MANLTVAIPSGSTVCDGKQITFRTPCSCSGITGININGTIYSLLNTMNESISNQSNSFSEGAMVSVVLDTVNNRAYIQNAAQLYNCDSEQNATFPAKVIATSFEGTASKAIADIDGNDIISTYATKSYVEELMTVDTTMEV